MVLSGNAVQTGWNGWTDMGILEEAVREKVRKVDLHGLR